MINEYAIGDNLHLLDNVSNDSIAMIYMDPPYNTGRDFNDFNDSYENMGEFKKFLGIRLSKLKEKLINHGNILVHIEPKISHHVRYMMDDIFGESNFRNEIVWKSGGNKTNKKQLARFHDVILHYSKTNSWKYTPQFIPYSNKYLSNTKICPIRKIPYNTTAAHNSQPNVNPRPNLRYSWKGVEKQWYITKENMIKLDSEGKLEYSKNGIPRFKKYPSEMKGVPVYDLWTDINQIQSGEKLNYATQKPVKLLERLVELYSDIGDIVLDPFAGSGTLGRAAINKNRKYILIDSNPEAKNIFLDSIK